MKTKILSSLVLMTGLAFSGSAFAQVKFGVACPVTGPNAAFGAQLVNGVTQAVEDINAAGGINGQKIVLAPPGDDVSDPKQGVSVANKFVADGIKFVIGHFNSGVTNPASTVYEEANILMVTPSATNPGITERGLYNVFRTCGRDDQQGLVAAEYILAHFKGKKIAILHDKTTYGKGLADETKKNLNAKGVTEVLYDGVNTGEKDYSAVVSKIKEAGADLLYWGGLQTEGGLIVRQMHDQGLKTVMMSGDGITTDEFAQIGGDAVEGTLMTFGPDATKNAAAAKIVKEFEAKKINPEAYTLYSYAAVQVLVEAANHEKTLDPKKIAAYIHSGAKFNTAIGDLSYNAKGDITRLDYIMYVWKKQPNGKITYVPVT